MIWIYMMMFFWGRRLDLAEHVLGAVLAGDAAEDLGRK